MSHCFKSQNNNLVYPSDFQAAVFTVGVVISFLIILLALERSSINLAICSFVILIVFLAKSVDYEISHPFIWFNFFFAAYSLSTPIMDILGEYVFYQTYAKNFDYTRIIFAEYLGMLAFSLAVAPRRIAYKISLFKDLKNVDPLIRGSYYVLILCVILSLTYIIAIVSFGLHDKRQKIIGFNPLFFIDFSWMIMTVAMSIILAQYRLLNRKFPIIFIIAFSLYISLALLVGGDRGPLFKYGLTLAMIFNIFYRKIKFRYFFAAFLIGMYLSTISGAFRMVLQQNISLADIGGLLLFDYSKVVLNILRLLQNTSQILLRITS